MDDGLGGAKPAQFNEESENVKKFLEIYNPNRPLEYLNINRHLDGNIACLVNGRHTAMATNDEIVKAGGVPANFIDVGDRHGGFDKDTMCEAVKAVMEDSEVLAVYINI